MEEEDFLGYMAKDFPEFQLTKNDLQSPTAPTLRKFFTTVLMHITRINTKHLCKFTDEQKEFIERYGEHGVFVNHLYNHNLYMVIKYIFENMVASPYDFHFSDLLFPFLSVKRTYVFMCFLYQLFATCAEFDSEFDRLETLVEKTNQISHLKQQIEEITDKIHSKERLRMENAERIKLIEKKLIEYASLHDESQALIKLHHEREVAECDKLKELEQAEQTNQDLRTKIENEKKYYEGLIVSDDAQILEKHEKLLKTREDSLLAIKELQMKVSQATNKSNKYDKVLLLQESLKQILLEEHNIGGHTLSWRELYHTAESLKKETQSLDEHEENLLQQIKEREGVMPACKVKCSEIETEIKSLKSYWKVECDKYDATIREMQQKLNETESSTSDHDNDMGDLQNVYATLEANAAALEDELKNQYDEFKRKFTSAEDILYSRLKEMNEVADEYMKENNHV